MIVQPVGGLAGFGRDESVGLEFGGAVVALFTVDDNKSYLKRS